MSIKLLKKLVNHEIKRFYVKNKLEQKEIIFNICSIFFVKFIWEYISFVISFFHISSLKYFKFSLL
nr:MAG TPA: hypothetical protein [Caudoviricetes sp.]